MKASQSSTSFRPDFYLLLFLLSQEHRSHHTTGTEGSRRYAAGQHTAIPLLDAGDQIQTVRTESRRADSRELLPENLRERRDEGAGHRTEPADRDSPSGVHV